MRPSQENGGTAPIAPISQVEPNNRARPATASQPTSVWVEVTTCSSRRQSSSTNPSGKGAELNAMDGPGGSGPENAASLPLPGKPRTGRRNKQGIHPCVRVD